ncbi:MAG: Gfo/Idh/MocA family oxidoreductase [Elusimicrobia bacterium]|nr:Gfo/Idh/MocA family oxidoreductase [Elusimicrobiota bacterium]
MRQNPAMPGLGICIVGCGQQAAVHAGIFRRQAGVRLVFASRELARAADYARRFAGEPCGSLAQACARPDIRGLVLCTPHDRHAADAKAALASGKAVLLEKPLALSAAEGEAVARAERDSGSKLLVGENYAFLPAVPAAIRILREGGIGRPRSVRALHNKRMAVSGWRLERARMGGGLLIDIGPHYLRLLQTLLGPIRRAKLRDSRRAIGGMEGESEFSLELDFGDGLSGVFEASWDRDWDRSLPNLLVEGEEGSLAYVADRPYLEWERETIRRVPFGAGDPLGREALVRHFLEVVGGAAPAVGADKGLEDLRVIEAAYRSAESGDWETVYPVGHGLQNRPGSPDPGGMDP